MSRCDHERLPAHSIVQATVDHDLPPLIAAAKRLLEAIPPDIDGDT